MLLLSVVFIYTGGISLTTLELLLVINHILQGMNSIFGVVCMEQLLVSSVWKRNDYLYFMHMCKG